MYIQYNISDGDIVTIQATSNQRADDAVLAAIGRAQFEIPDGTDTHNVSVNIITGEILPLNAAFNLTETRDEKLLELKYYYNSDEPRSKVYGNRLIIVNQSAKNGTTELRARLKDNGDVTTCEWYFDDGTSQTLDVSGIVTLNKFVIDQDQKLRKIRNLHVIAINALTDRAEIAAYNVKSNINGMSW